MFDGMMLVRIHLACGCGDMLSRSNGGLGLVGVKAPIQSQTRRVGTGSRARLSGRQGITESDESRTRVTGSGGKARFSPGCR